MNRFFTYLLLVLVSINSSAAYSVAPAKARAGPATSYGKKASPAVAAPSKDTKIMKAKVENKKLISKNIKFVDKNAKAVNKNIKVVVKTSPTPKVAAKSTPKPKVAPSTPKSKVAAKMIPKPKVAAKMTPKVSVKPKNTKAVVTQERVNPAVFKQTAYVGSVALAVLLPILFLLAASK